MSNDARRLLFWQVAVVSLMVVGYSGCYLCRSNFSVSLNLIAASLVEQGRDPDDARIWLGTIASAGTLAYAIGKFFTGSVADFSAVAATCCGECWARCCLP